MLHFWFPAPVLHSTWTQPHPFPPTPPIHYDGHSIQSSSEELRCQSIDPRPHHRHQDDQLTSSHFASEAQAQSPSAAPSVTPLHDSGPISSHAVYNVKHSFFVFCFSYRTNPVDASLHHPWLQAQCQTEGNFGRMCQSQPSVGLLAGVTHAFLSGFFPSQLCVPSFYTHQQFSTQILHRVGLSSCAEPRVESHSEVPPAHS